MYTHTDNDGTMDFRKWNHSTRFAPDADDQLPLIAHVGRGLRGDGYKIDLIDTDAGQYLAGYPYDATTGTYSETPDWTSDLIGSGVLEYSVYKPAVEEGETPFMQITFRYTGKGGEDSWQFTTDQIPLMGETTNNGGHVDSVFVTANTPAGIWNPDDASETDTWHETLRYPDDWSAAHPDPDTSDWVSLLTYGSGGVLDVPSYPELAKLLGRDLASMRQLIDPDAEVEPDPSISDQIAALEALLAGFPAGDDNQNVKQYIDDTPRILDAVYPVGSIYLSVDSTNPGTLFGVGEWERIQGRFLLGASSSYAAGSTGGRTQFQISPANLPPHNHTLPAHLAIYDSDYKYKKSTVSPWLQAGTGKKTVSTAQNPTWETYNTGNGTPGTFSRTAINIMPPYLAVYMWKRIS